MQVDPLDTNETTEVALTKLVYTLVMEPERLYLMLQLLNDSVSPVFDLDEGGRALSEKDRVLDRRSSIVVL